MPRFLRKIITLGLIITLLVPRGFIAVSPVIAQESPTSAPAAPTSAPEAPRSDPQPTSAPSQPQPTNAPQPSQTEPQPTATEQQSSQSGSASTNDSQQTSDSSTSQSGRPEGDNQDSRDRDSRNDRSDEDADGDEAAGSGTGGTAQSSAASTTTNNPENTDSVGNTGSTPYPALAGPNGTAAAAYVALYGATAPAAEGNSASGGINDPANTVTGPGSTNTATETTTVSQETMNKNIANLTNLLNLNAYTGFNYANLNTLPGQVVTGDADNTLNLLNKLNTNISGIGGFATYDIYGTQTGDITFSMANGPADGSFNTASGQVAKNAVTGPGSSNTATSQDGFTVKEANGNDAQITNTIALKSITGENSASFNTLGGTVSTGDANTLANIINMVNTNIHAQEWLFGVVNIYGSLYGNIILPADTAGTPETQGTTTAQNSTTGPLSDNTASTSTDDTKTFTTANTADITSNLKVDANTGNNDASFNTYGSTIETGDAQALVNNTSIANVNAVNEEGTIWLVIVNEMGKWVGKIIGAAGETNIASSLPFTTSSSGDPEQTYTVDATNAVTGPQSENNSSYAATSDQSITSENTAGITNNIIVKSDTGNNEASKNTGPASIQTGDAKAGINLLNLANVNLVAKKVVILFVNVLGSFFGDVVPPDQQKEREIAAPGTVPHSTPPGGTGGTDGISGSSQTQTAFEHASNDVGYTTNTTAGSSGTSPSVSVSTGGSKTASVSLRQTARSRNRSKTVVAGASTQMVSMTPTVTPSKLKRGIFISPAFAQAGESTAFASLFRGARINVTNAWLVIVPFAAGVLYIRRRHRIDLKKYINGMLNAFL